MTKKKYKVAVVGATGAVGRELLSLLQSRNFPMGGLRLFSSPRSLGRIIQFGQFPGEPHAIEVLQKGCFAGVDFVFFDASDAVSREWVPEAAASGCWVIDNSAVFRMADDVPLLVPEINGSLIDGKAGAGVKRGRIIAGPNCSTVQLVLALHPIRERWGLERVIVSTYQSASGAGSAAMDELSAQAASVLGGKPLVPPKAFAHPIAFNCIPQIGGAAGSGPGGADDEGFTSEETKIIQESRKILGIPDLRVTATAVRVPTFSCHGESVNIECSRPFTIAEVREALQAQPGIVLQDDLARGIYPMGIGATGRDAVYVGRIRKDRSTAHGLHLWVVSDNLRKGAALNAIQIGEILVRNGG